MRRDLGSGGDLGCRLRNMVFLALVLVVIAGWCAPVMGAVRLAVTEEAYWDKSQVGIGRWKKVERAEEYRVRLRVRSGLSPVSPCGGQRQILASI